MTLRFGAAVFSVPGPSISRPPSHPCNYNLFAMLIHDPFVTVVCME